MSRIGDYKAFLSLINGDDVTVVEKEGDLRKSNLTIEEKARDKQITKLLKAYVTNYENKIEFNKLHKQIILWFCITTLGIFFLTICAFIILFAIGCIKDTKGLVGLITSLISFVGMFIGVLQIITKYVFPKDEEQYITKIVEDIQKNDLKNKKADMYYSTKNKTIKK